MGNGSIVNIFHKILERTDLSRIVRNASWLIVDKLINIIAGFFVGAWVARYLGPS